MRPVLALLVALAFAGVAVAAPATHPRTGACPASRSVTGDTITRDGGAPGPHRTFTFPARTTAGAGAARALAAAICGLPFARGVLHCPIDGTLRYRVRFGGVAAVTADPFGCEIVSGFGAPRTAIAAPAFWSALGHAVGLKASTRVQLQGG